VEKGKHGDPIVVRETRTDVRLKVKTEGKASHEEDV
jgi:hypothetical protein